jgi:DNA (cytosine-5)-methyltransferase 1
LSNKRKPVAVDLFCGAGGMSLGFEMAGFSVKAAIDRDEHHVTAYRINFPDAEVLEADLSMLTGTQIRQQARLGSAHIDVVFGGPPCQGFSMIGRKDINDERNQLLLHFIRLVSELKPTYFVVENVQGLMFSHARGFLDKFKRRAADAGYLLVEPIQVLDASEFGVPQRRLRTVIIGYRANAKAAKYPTPHPSEEKPTVWDAIGDLPNVDDYPYLLKTDVFSGRLKKPSPFADKMQRMFRDKSGKWKLRKHPSPIITSCANTVHSAKMRRRFEKTASGETEPTSHLYRLKAEGLSRTIRAGTDSTRGSYTAPRPIHPLHPRCVTVREAARLQSFPDSFYFHPTIWHGCRQVGNAVPPLLAFAIAAKLIQDTF